jgi:septum formation protein
MNRPIILASTSPRRQSLLRDAGFNFIVKKPDVNESFPPEMSVEEVAEYIARKKADYFKPVITEEIIITADTTVVIDDLILNKPVSYNQAFDMLTQLAGKTHRVITGVCILSKENEISFSDETEVTFCDLTPKEISYYINRFKPFDKAGAYGIQDWIGLVGVQRIKGSYFNVMGLPVHLIYRKLKTW